MSSLGDIFDSTVSKIVANDKKNSDKDRSIRMEGEKTLRERGIFEIFEHIVTRTQSTNKTESEKIICEKLNQILTQNFYQLYGWTPSWNDHNHCYAVKEVFFKDNQTYGFSIQTQSQIDLLNTLTVLCTSSQDIYVYIDDKTLFQILPNDSKDDIFRKTIELLLHGEITS